MTDFKVDGKCPWYEEAEIPCEECEFYSLCEFEADMRKYAEKRKEMEA